jgi:hypothetical protein
MPSNNVSTVRLIRNACLWAPIWSSLVGCAVDYRAPGTEATPISGLAVVSFSESPELGTIVEVDGVTRPNAEVRRYELMPGKHTVRLKVNAGISIADMSITFSVDAGKDYQIVAVVESPKEKEATVSVKVHDKVTGQEIPREVHLLNLSLPPGSRPGY